MSAGPGPGRPPTSSPGADRLLPHTWRRPVLGVLGGMGPAASVAFLDALTRATPARTDQDHIDTVVLSHASTPDRTARLRDPDQPDPTPYLVGDLELLGRLGVDLAVIVCNTAHAFLDEAAVPVRLLNIVEVGAEAAVEQAGPSGAVLLLATDGTLASRLYQDALERRGASVRLPSAADQRRVMSLIYDRVKAGVEVPPAELAAMAAELRGDARTVLLGCTELSVVFDQAATAGTPLPGYVVDAQDELVTRVVAELAPPS